MVTLVCGVADEAPIAMLIKSLKKKKMDYLVIDQRTMAEAVKLRWQVTERGIAGKLRIGEDTIDIREIRSVYHRFVDPADMPGDNTSPGLVSKTRSVLHSLMDLLDVLPAKVINRRRPMMSNNSKPYQALLIRKAGFLTPETLITNNPNSLTEFASLHGSLIYKSISSVRSIVNTLDDKSSARLDSLQYLPTQFQRKINGHDVRVHVAGRRLFATQIITSATDYRYAGEDDTSVEFKPYTLNVKLRHKCLRLSRISQLPFAGIDLKIDNGKVYCFEINPCPGYSYYQTATGQPISDALADDLSRPRLVNDMSYASSRLRNN